MLSARNKLSGKVRSVKKGDVMAEVIVEVGGGEVAALISRTSADQLDLKEGDEVRAVVKATEVMIEKD